MLGRTAGPECSFRGKEGPWSGCAIGVELPRVWVGVLRPLPVGVGM